mmetsp:Transcript_38640/g.64165  ORF Transcript_38640/g.64165 Transcript_38640/m.64165 type:complete len:437 (+) Transcript_38640:79-1389(+)
MAECILNALEAESAVSNLATFQLKEVGNSRWTRQHEWLQKLNVQAHLNATSRGDEYVMEALVSHDKIPVLIHELILMEVYKAKVFPLAKNDLCQSDNDVKAYLLMYNEAVICNLLEITLYHKTACAAAGDVLVDLADYLYRKIIKLDQKLADDAYEGGVASKKVLDKTREQVLNDNWNTIEFNVCMSALSILRFLTDNIQAIPLSVLTRLLQVHDIICALVPLVERPPWLRREKGGKLLCFEDGNWRSVAAEERGRVTKPQAQVWLALHNLLCDPECTQRYRYDSFRKSTVLRLKSHLHETLLDQIPPLTQLQRSLEYLTMMDPPEAAKNNVFVLEQIPEIADRILKNVDLGEVLEYQRKHVINQDPETRRQDMARLAEAYTLGVEEGANLCAVCGKLAPTRCSRCKQERYCTRECQIKGWPKHKPLCSIRAAAAS